MQDPAGHTINELHAASRGTHGTRRMHAMLLHDRGRVVHRKLVRRIMSEECLCGLPLRRRGRRNLKNSATHEDLINREFNAAVPNQLWLTDVTEHKTRERSLYCCVVLDMCSRRIVGWAIDRRNDAVLANDALAMAARPAHVHRRPFCTATTDRASCHGRSPRA
jgi:putative transposase